MTLIAINQVSHGYASAGLFRHGQKKAVLEDISLEIRVGETLALLGRSGCAARCAIRDRIFTVWPAATHSAFARMCRWFSRMP